MGERVDEDSGVAKAAPAAAGLTGATVARRVFRAAALVAALLLAGWVAFSAVNGMLRSNVVEARIAETQAEIDELRRDADKLAALVAWLESDAYVEWSAREDLGLVRPGRGGVRGPRAATRGSGDHALAVVGQSAAGERRRLSTDRRLNRERRAQSPARTSPGTPPGTSGTRDSKNPARCRDGARWPDRQGRHRHGRRATR